MSRCRKWSFPIFTHYSPRLVSIDQEGHWIFGAERRKACDFCCVRCMRGVIMTTASKAMVQQQWIVSRHWFRASKGTKSQRWPAALLTALPGVPPTLCLQLSMNQCSSSPPKIHLELDIWVSYITLTCGVAVVVFCARSGVRLQRYFPSLCVCLLRDGDDDHNNNNNN